jgi:hypothetical protein
MFTIGNVALKFLTDRGGVHLTIESTCPIAVYIHAVKSSADATWSFSVGDDRKELRADVTIHRLMINAARRELTDDDVIDLGEM